VLFEASLETDRAEAVPKGLLDVLADAGLYGLFAARQAGGLGLDKERGEEVIETLATGCLTTTFVWLQHLSTASLISNLDPVGPIYEKWGHLLATGERRSGIAFSHLRHDGPPALTAIGTSTGGAGRPGYTIEGTAPLVTGWGLVDVVRVAALDPAGSEIYWLLVDARPSPTLRATRLELAAVNASATVRLDFSGHFAPEERLVAVEALSDWIERDTAGLRTNGVLALGVARRCLSLLGESPLHSELDALRERLYAAGPSEMPRARADVSLFALRAASSLVAAGGGRAMSRESHAQRLAREALFLLVQGQTEPIRAAQLASLEVSQRTGEQ
jgi:alkylation response protein AidB-like acyl-CoA dehydrogenase